MPGDVGLVAKLVDTVFSWFTDEAGYLEIKKQRAIASKKEECRRALLDNRWADLKRLTDELHRLATKA
jgi:hypothetical protein